MIVRGQFDPKLPPFFCSSSGPCRNYPIGEAGKRETIDVAVRTIASAEVDPRGCWFIDGVVTTVHKEDSIEIRFFHKVPPSFNIDASWEVDQWVVPDLYEWSTAVLPAGWGSMSVLCLTLWKVGMGLRFGHNIWLIQNVSSGHTPTSTSPVREPEYEANILLVTIAEPEVFDKQPVLHVVDVIVHNLAYKLGVLMS